MALGVVINYPTPGQTAVDPRTNFIYTTTGDTFYHVRSKYSGVVEDTYYLAGGRAAGTYYFNPVSDLSPNTGYTLVLEVSDDPSSPPGAGSWVSSTSVSFTTGPLPPGEVSNPNPADEAIDVSITLSQLSWDAADYATSYEVFLNGDSIGTVAETYISLAGITPLDVLTNYTWQVDAINSTDTNTGPLWEFVTGDGKPPKPINPTPADAATGVVLGLGQLTWEAG